MVLLLSVFSFSNGYSQTDYSQGEGLGLPGDNLNLSAVLDIFQKSKTLEEFETSLNSDNYKINNLDLNYDGKVDYIKVNDYPQGNTHAIMLEVDVNKNESQSVAVIYVDKKNNGNVDIQIVGDEALYGKNYVIDPGNNQYANGTPNPGYTGGDEVYDNYNNYNDGYVSPASWGIITYMYMPSYSVWNSPWYWGYYPRMWNPWSPFYWNDYYYHCYHDYSWGWNYYYYGRRNRFRSLQGWYGRERRVSSVYNNNRQKGLYDQSYQGRPPVRKPMTGKLVNNGVVRKNDAVDRGGSTTPINNRRGNNNTQATPGVRQGNIDVSPSQPANNIESRPAERAVPRQNDAQPAERARPQESRPIDRNIRPQESRPVERMNRPEPVQRQESRPVQQPSSPQGTSRPRGR